MQELKQALEVLAIKQTPAEFHGIICGLLATGKSTQKWLIDVIGARDKNNLDTKEAVLALSKIISKNQQSLQSQGFTFNLVLPNESTPITTRIQEFGNFCDGFLFGFALSGVKVEDDTEIAEILRDFSELARVDFSEDPNNENELALMEIAEYAKVAVLLVYLEFNQNDDVA